LALALGLVGCRDDDNNNNTVKYDTGGTGGDGGTVYKDGGGSTTCTESTLCKIKDGTAKKGSCVTLKDVIVTAVDTAGSYTKDVFVQAKDGTKTCGIKLYRPTRGDGKLVTDLKPGTHVKIKGTVKWWHPKAGEISDKNYPNKKHIKELEKATITVLTSGAAPTPIEATVAQLTDKATANSYEDLFVKIKAVAVAKKYAADAKYKNVDIMVVDKNGKSMELRDDLASLSAVKELGCHDVTGIATYFYGYRVQPTKAADVATATGCLTPKAIKIADIQDSTSASAPKLGDWLKLSAVITAVDANPYVDKSSSAKKYTGFFIQDDAGKGTYDGLYVYYIWASNSQEKVPAAGKKIELTGFYDEYYKQSQVKDVRWTESGTGTVTAVEIDPSKFASDKTFGPKYEGMLVKIKNVEVGELAKTTKGSVIGIKDKTSKLPIEIEMYNFMKPVSPAVAPKVGDKFTSITGIVAYTYSAWKIFPRAAADLVK